MLTTLYQVLSPGHWLRRLGVVAAAIGMAWMVQLLLPKSVAQTVYKTVEEGVTSFSDTPPSDGLVEVLTIEVAPAADDRLLEERLAAMRETTDRMAGDRRERERHRAELRSLQSAPAPAAVATAQPEAVWMQGVWPRISRPNRHVPPFSPMRPLPPIGVYPQPAAQAPPGWSVMQPGNAQLMRPILSAGRP